MWLNLFNGLTATTLRERRPTNARTVPLAVPSLIPWRDDMPEDAKLRLDFRLVRPRADPDLALLDHLVRLIKQGL